MDWSATPSGLTGDHNAPPKRLTRWTPIIAHRRAASANSMQLRIGRAGSQSETGEFFLSRDSFCMGSSDAGVSVGVSDASVSDASLSVGFDAVVGLAQAGERIIEQFPNALVVLFRPSQLAL